MRKLINSLLLFLFLTLAWYGFWRYEIADDVTRIKTSIDYQNQQFKTTNPTMVFKAESVTPSGFPFHFRIKVTRATLSMINGRDTYAVSIPELYLEPGDTDQGRYTLHLPPTIDALYATDGKAPENYRITPNPIPAIAIRAQGDSQQCSNFPGMKRCDPVKPDAPIISYAAQLPKSITLHMELNGESRDAAFEMIPIDIPIFQTIPTDLVRPLELFIGVLREALVFKTK